jgi:hypothetical protein
MAEHGAPAAVQKMVPTGKKLVRVNGLKFEKSYNTNIISYSCHNGMMIAFFITNALIRSDQDIGMPVHPAATHLL